MEEGPHASLPALRVCTSMGILIRAFEWIPDSDRFG
jgi:hypothetical protein